VKRYAALAAPVAALSLIAASPGLAHHTDAVAKVSTIRVVYPDLYARELARPTPSWNHLRRMARTRWHRTHPIAAAIAHRATRRSGGGDD
jgi:hypothetical protein